ncbi:hypothetical protein [Geomesophilobacter sediminis]|uniref:Uncharacterized protein n=1 Tax=Geomesophilobacter sediminis TaxID=2798584 RepID=A0A8J7M0R8_9BACT|nr:hypothetical protein [Geomesophilobacter sediminis]MBJ6726489.1 hypothetical protein [Geomesophilobacter sediminis]
MSIYLDMPADMEVREVILERVLQNTGALLEICVVRHGNQYEAAVFMEHKYKPGPPLPRPLESPAGEKTHWMGVRPKIGLTTEEADQITYEVQGVNALYRIQMRDNWGATLDVI